MESLKIPYRHQDGAEEKNAQDVLLSLPPPQLTNSNQLSTMKDRQESLSWRPKDGVAKSLGRTFTKKQGRFKRPFGIENQYGFQPEQIWAFQRPKDKLPGGQ